MNGRPPFAKGFTLLEVLVAFTICAISAGALLHALSRNLSGTAIVEEYAMAGRLARSLLARQGNDIAVSEGRTRGVFDDKYSWTRVVRPYTDVTPENPVGLRPYWIELTVRWHSGTRTRSITVNNLRLVSDGAPPS